MTIKAQCNKRTIATIIISNDLWCVAFNWTGGAMYDGRFKTLEEAKQFIISEACYHGLFGKLSFRRG